MKEFDEIRFFKKCVPEKAIEHLLSKNKNSIPLLINELELAIRRRNHLGNYYVGHIFSLILLGKMKEKSANPLIYEILNLPSHEIERMFGDILFLTLPSIILNTYDGNPEPLFKILDNSKVEFPIRNLAGACLASLVHNQKLNSKALLDHIFLVWPQKKSENDTAFFTVIAQLAAALKLETLYPSIREAYQNNTIEQFFISEKDFEEAIKRPIQDVIFPDYLNPAIDISKIFSDFEEYSNSEPEMPNIDPESLCPCGSQHHFKECCKSRMR